MSSDRMPWLLFNQSVIYKLSTIVNRFFLTLLLRTFHILTCLPMPGHPSVVGGIWWIVLGWHFLPCAVHEGGASINLFYSLILCALPTFFSLIWLLSASLLYSPACLQLSSFLLLVCAATPLLYWYRMEVHRLEKSKGVIFFSLAVTEHSMDIFQGSRVFFFLNHFSYPFEPPPCCPLFSFQEIKRWGHVPSLFFLFRYFN